MLILGIDPAKNVCHCSLVKVADLGQPSFRPLLQVCESVEWCDPAGWVRLVDLCRMAERVALETQWISQDDTSKWSGIAPLLETRGAVRVACLTSGRPLVLLGPGEWRAVSLAPRPFGSRAIARKSERAAWTALWGVPHGPGRSTRTAACKLPPGLGPDTGAGALIALAAAGVNVHTWISL